MLVSLFDDDKYLKGMYDADLARLVYVCTYMYVLSDIHYCTYVRTCT